jgi:hypothetical protein
LFRTGNISVQILAFCAFSLFFGDVEAARHKDFGSQNNIYLTDWARLKHRAELGDPDALFILGNYYFKPPKGNGFRKNLKKSAEYYFKSAVRGNAAAQYNFALMLHNGFGVNKSAFESYVWFKLASLNESPVAKHVNQESAKIVIRLETLMKKEVLVEAGKKVVLYGELIKNKRYRSIKFSG